MTPSLTNQLIILKNRIQTRLHYISSFQSSPGSNTMCFFLQISDTLALFIPSRCSSRSFNYFGRFSNAFFKITVEFRVVVVVLIYRHLVATLAWPQPCNMAATGKKGKKAKWIPANITDILAEPTTIPTTQNWADAVEDDTESYGYSSSRSRAPVVLPSASRAARGGMAVDDDSIPRRPPFVAHISNLPYDVDETAIQELFEGLKILNLRLPREGDRLKGYGYVDFEDRDSLINAMNMPDLSISGRRVRIEVSTQDNDRRGGRGGMMGSMGRSDMNREYDPERTTGDWRSGPRAQPEPGRARNMDRERDRPDRDSSADKKPGAWRDGDRAAAEPARTPYGGRDSYSRNRDGDRERASGFGAEGSAAADNRPGGWRDGERPAPEPARAAPYAGRDSRGRDDDRYGSSGGEQRAGAWRDGDRPAPEPARTPYGGRDSRGRDDDRGRERGFGGRDGERGYGGRERDGERGYGGRERDGERGYGGRDAFRGGDRDGAAFGSRDRGFGGRGLGDRDPPPREDAKPRERPKLQLLPRTVPRDDAPAPGEDAPAHEDRREHVPKADVFGAAKPVDTAAKEREIEERLRKREEEARRGGGEERERWARKNDDSGDRRSGARRDDRRPYSKDDRRDYSKDESDRRGNSRDEGDRRGNSRDDRDRQGNIRDDRERRGNSRDDRERRGNSRDDRERRGNSRDDRELRGNSRDERDRRGSSRDERDRRGTSRDEPDPQGTSRDERDRRGTSRDGKDRRDYSSDKPRRDPSGDRRHGDESRSRDASRERNGKPDERESVAETERALPKVKEQEKPNFVASNKFSFLEDAGADSD